VHLINEAEFRMNKAILASAMGIATTVAGLFPKSLSVEVGRLSEEEQNGLQRDFSRIGRSSGEMRGREISLRRTS
jgi:hypothetical protein